MLILSGVAICMNGVNSQDYNILLLGRFVLGLGGGSAGLVYNLIIN